MHSKDWTRNAMIQSIKRQIHVSFFESSRLHSLKHYSYFLNTVVNKTSVNWMPLGHPITQITLISQHSTVSLSDCWMPRKYTRVHNMTHEKKTQRSPNQTQLPKGKMHTWWFHARVDGSGSGDHLFPDGILVAHLTDVLNGCLYAAAVGHLLWALTRKIHGQITQERMVRFTVFAWNKSIC